MNNETKYQVVTQKVIDDQVYLKVEYTGSLEGAVSTLIRLRSGSVEDMYIVKSIDYRIEEKLVI